MTDELQKRIWERLDFSREMSDEEVRFVIEEEVRNYTKQYAISIEERVTLEQGLFNSLRKMDVLQELLDRNDITEIMVNGPNHIFYEKAGELVEWDKHFSSREKLEDVIQQMVGTNNRMVNESTPIVDTRLKDGSRVNIVLSPISIDGAAVSIRKFPEKPFQMEDLIEKESITREAAEFLRKMVEAKYNIFVSGGTGSGKTTFLNVLSGFIPKNERILTIEDSAELQIQGNPNLVRLETRNANLEGVDPITIRDLIKTALRMRPDRIVVGECRGAEALDVLQAMNTGHDGSLSTGHANSCKDMLSRLETMVLMGMELPLAAIRSQIASGVDLLVHLGRLPDHSRKVFMIAEIEGIKEGEIIIHPLYELQGKLKKVGTLHHTEKCEMAGIRLSQNEEESQPGFWRENRNFIEE